MVFRIKKGFTLVELLVVVAILGVLAAVGIVTFGGFLGNAKENATISNHKQVVKFIQASIMKCNMGEELILKHNPTTNTSDLCAKVSSGNSEDMVSHFVNHFLTLKWCNSYGFTHTNGTCEEGVASGGYDASSVGTGGKLGEVNLKAKHSTPKINDEYVRVYESIIIVDTRIEENKWLVDSIDLND